MQLVSLFNILICIAALVNPVKRDYPNSDIHSLMRKGNTTYIIRYNHSLETPLDIPEGVTLLFKGGSLSGQIHMNNTLLEGDIKLTGSVLSGGIKNEYFKSSWICYADNKHDDAANINSMLSVCKKVIIERGEYLLSSYHAPNTKLGYRLGEQVKSHIGINQSGVEIHGQSGAIFRIQNPSTAICIYSLPNDIEHSIGDVLIEGITFINENSGDYFNQYNHCIKINGVNGLTIKNCEILDFFGDAICLNHYGDTDETGERTRNTNVVIEQNIIRGDSHNNRNGISVINGKNVKIKNNKIFNTSKSNMPGAIDIESNGSAYTIENIEILDNYIEGSKGAVGAICLVSILDGSPLHNIHVEGNVIKDSNIGIAVYIHHDGLSDYLSFINNEVSEDTEPYYFSGKGKSTNWIVRNNRFMKKTHKRFGGSIKIDNYQTDLK